MTALVATADGVYEVDVDREEVLGVERDARLPPPAHEELGLPRLVASSSVGSTVVAVVDRRPPLVVSYDAARTWREAGGGLPPGRAVAVAPDNPDLILYASRNRLYLSRDGGRFWRVLAPELPEIESVAWRERTAS